MQDVILDNNLYVANEIVGSVGGNGMGGHRFVNTAIVNNVATHFGRDQGPSLGVGMEITDWDGGIIAGNLYRGPRFAGVQQNWAFLIGSRQWKDGAGWGGSAPKKPDDPPLTPGKGLRNVLITRNTFYDMDGGWPLLQVNGPGIGDFLDKVTFSDNRLQMPGIERPLLRIAKGDIKNFVFSGNAYHTGGAEWFTVDRSPATFEQWVEISGEKGATDKPVKFADPERSLLAYMKHLGHEANLEAFYSECRKQNRRNWRPACTAAAVNAWIREGFGMKRIELEEAEDGDFATPFRLSVSDATEKE